MTQNNNIFKASLLLIAVFAISLSMATCCSAHRSVFEAIRSDSTCSEVALSRKASKKLRRTSHGSRVERVLKDSLKTGRYYLEEKTVITLKKRDSATPRELRSRCSTVFLYPSHDTKVTENHTVEYNKL